MKIIYLLNRGSKTSIPIIWANYTSKKFKNIIINIFSLKHFSIKKLHLILNADIIHGHHIKIMYLFLIFNLLLKKKTVYTVHGSFLYLSKSNKQLLKYIFKNSNKIVFVNKFLYDVLPKEYKKLIDNKYEIILNGIELNLKYKKIDVYKKYNINENDRVIFHPARFVKEKNHLNIVKAFALLHEKISNAKLIIAGDGSLREEIEEEIKRLELGSNIKLLGLIDREEVYNFLEKIDLFIMPSISEGLNIAFLEAMVFKRKILVSNIYQFTYPFEHYNLNPNDYNVYFTSPNDINEIFKQMNFLITQKRNENFNMDYFSIESMMKEYIEIYEELT